MTGWGENDRGVSHLRLGHCEQVPRRARPRPCLPRPPGRDGYEFFAKRQLVTVFSAPNYCGEFDNAGAMMSVDDTLMCSFQILKPAEKRSRGQAAGSLPGTPPGPASPPAKKAKQ